MKILLTTLNAKFVHTALALWYLYQFCRQDHPGLYFKEFNINQELSWIHGEIDGEHAEVVAFSCNIWNIGQTLILCQRIKSITPETIIVLGGSEVSANPREIMEKNPAVDFIIVGEGELTFKEWLYGLERQTNDWVSIGGLVFRQGSQIIQNDLREDIPDLSVIPFPYPEDLTPFRKKLVYYETTRGCPYACQYCLSANEHGVRYFPLERVKKELLRFIEADIAQIKFVDRSFNCNPAWAKEIWRFLLAAREQHSCQTNFHFEIVGDLLDDESLGILAQAPAGFFQFEIGVQSTNPDTLALIERRMNFDRLGENVLKLRKSTQVFVHLDLIAGLPGEDYQSFAKTFNDNLLLKPNRLQLGFLKLLHGSGLRNKASDYGFIFTQETPYEVMASHWISYEELLKLKTIEDMLERYYNSGRFKLSFDYLIPQFDNPFQLFEKFAVWWKKRGFDAISHKTKDLYDYLLQFYTSLGFENQKLQNLLKYDLLSSERMVELPSWAGKSNPDLHPKGYRFWQNEQHRQKYIPGLQDLAVRDIQRRIIFEKFDCNPLLLAAAPLDEPQWGPHIFLFIYESSKVIVYPISKEEFDS
ncbi:MAG TPA: B12-binding domain-containing radical SAM protein [Firmicutes bacterium]|jgi:radical SAM superfamily enzyme YgiQ (UPF0313 family)|nr:B12-binding domain-containing radical SAM protein [Bacillota bacterium]